MSLHASSWPHFCAFAHPYDPTPQDPSFPGLYASLPSYLAKLHSRYPPVCPDCQPAVDSALRKADHRAQVEAWGSALRRGASRADEVESAPGWAEVLVWRVRGVLWASSAILSLGLGLLGWSKLSDWEIALTGGEGSISPAALVVLGAATRRRGLDLPLSMLGLHCASLLWIAWDPYWLRRVRSQDNAKLRGRPTWIVRADPIRDWLFS
jgi:hypothetical protein